MNIMGIITQLATLFILMGAGYVCNKAGITNGETNKHLTKLVLNLTMPCTILNSVIGGVNVTGSETLYFMLMTIPVFVLFFAVSIPVSRVLSGEKRDSGLYAYMIALGNAAFMGFPVSETVYGAESAFFVALFNIPFTLAAFSIGILLISGGRGKSINPKVLINPCLITALFALVIFITGLKIPGVIAGSVKLASGMTTPCAMLVIGGVLAELPIREMFTQWRLYIMTAFRLIIVPVIIWLIMKNFIRNELMLGVIVLLSAMPTATTATMLAGAYGGNEKLASQGIFLTTLMSVFTIPLIVFLLLS